MKLCLVSEYFPSVKAPAITGGVEARGWFLARLLARSHEVTVITSWRTGLPRQEMIDGVRIHRMGLHHDYANEGSVLSRLQFALAAWRGGVPLGPFDIVDGCNFIAYLPAYNIARRTGALAVATYNEVWCGNWVTTKGLMVGLLGELWERLGLALDWDHFVAISQFTANCLGAHGIKASRITVIPCGVAIAEIARVPAGPRKDGAICMAARLVKGKQTEVLLRALAMIKTADPHLMDRLHLTICGDGPLLEPCRRLTAALGLVPQVTFLGRLAAHADVFRLMKESTLLVHPSVLEGFGIVPVEASVCGTPVLTADIAVLAEVGQLLGGGRTFQAGSAEDLAGQIVAHFTTNPILVGNPAGLDWSSLCEQLEALYLRLLASRRRQPLADGSDGFSISKSQP
jgi:glycosyltransferase involved in cell wall biosynthesis